MLTCASFTRVSALTGLVGVAIGQKREQKVREAQEDRDKAQEEFTVAQDKARQYTQGAWPDWDGEPITPERSTGERRIMGGLREHG
jgi:hypothetical protein